MMASRGYPALDNAGCVCATAAQCPPALVSPVPSSGRSCAFAKELDSAPESSEGDRRDFVYFDNGFDTDGSVPDAERRSHGLPPTAGGRHRNDAYGVTTPTQRAPARRTPPTQTAVAARPVSGGGA